MRKIHITLVGGQTAPVYNGIIYTNPDKVVYIYSEESKTQVEQIENEIKIPSEKRKFAPVDLSDIEKKVLQCQETFKDNEVSINISSGTKPWAYFFTEIFGKESNTQIFYIDQNNVVWNLTRRTRDKVSFNMESQFRLYGNTLTSYIDFFNMSDDDKNAVTEIIEVNEFNPNIFFALIARAKQLPNLTDWTVGNSFLSWIKQEKSFEFYISKFNKKIHKKISSPNIRTLLLKSGWFEYKVATLLSKWDKIKDIRLNCVFSYEKQGAKNEIDIIANTGDKLLFVECKTQIEDNTDIDKFRSAVNNYGGMGSKALFITEVKMSDKAQEKCNDNGILSFSIQDNHLGMSTEKALQILLESELFNINTR